MFSVKFLNFSVKFLHFSLEFLDFSLKFLHISIKFLPMIRARYLSNGQEPGSTGDSLQDRELCLLQIEVQNIMKICNCFLCILHKSVSHHFGQISKEKKKICSFVHLRFFFFRNLNLSTIFQLEY